jgi:hypothetical protein
MLRRLLTLTVWVLSTAGGLAAVIAPHPAIRGAGVAVAITAGALWAHRVTAEHFAAVAEENEAWAGTRHVVFGASEEATRVQLAELYRLIRTSRARIEANRRRRRRGPHLVSIGFDPACDPPGVVGLLSNGRWWPGGTLQDRR